MQEDNRKIRDAIKKMAKGNKILVSIPAKVIDVNGHLCDVEPVNGDAEILDVRLQTSNVKGQYLKPKINSIVYISMLDEDNYFVSTYGELELIELGGDEYGGLTITPELQKQLDVTNELLKALILVIDGPPIPEPGAGAPSAFQTALKSALIGQSLGDYSNIENETITHGKLG